MDPENNASLNKESTNVSALQTLLFPISPRSPRRVASEGYLSNFLLKRSSIFEQQPSDAESLKANNFKEIYAKESNCTVQLPRWPTECQVLDERIKHISYVPPTMEAYYQPTGKEVMPKPVGEECGEVVYQYYPVSAVNYFSRSSVGGSRFLLPTCPNPEVDSLKFESRFESGNLAKAIKITASFYELYLRTDLYTNRHTQWFYFRVTNMRKNIMYRFSIVNMSKDESLYNEGMRPLLYSVKDSQLHQIGWRRFGENIKYYSNENVTPEDPDQQELFTLTFTTEFPHENDTIYIAHSYPYTYSDLQDYLMEMTSHPVKSTFSTLRLLCKTLAGNNVYFITITAPQSPGGENKKKRAIVITARVHPGETPSSWMMKGFLDFLTSDTGPAKELREKFIFKLVPMLNPDGVIVGNNRCSLTGRDLNRQYRTVIRETYPSIWYTKLMIRRLLEECGVAMYCDLHAHSRKHNIFIYGCESRRGSDKRLHEQVFPLMLHKNAADKFSFESCKFRIQRSKEGTGRVVMWMMGIANSYTMEASFGGSLLGNRAESHFGTQDYEHMGRLFCQTLLDFYDDDPRKERLRLKIIERLLMEGSNADEPTNIRLSDYSSDDGDTSSSSSCDEAGGDDFSIILTVPPSSPVVTNKKPKPKITSKSKSLSSKSPGVCRKVMQITKTSLRLSIAKDKARFTDTSSGTDSDSESSIKEREATKKQKQKKKKFVKRQKKVTEFSETELGRRYPERSVSVLDILPDDKLRSNQRPSAHPPPRYLQDKRNTTLQLAEVQAKLLSMKNKLWQGTDEINAPLSYNLQNVTRSPSKTQKKKAKDEKDKKKTKQKLKSGNEKQKKDSNNKEKSSKKNQNGLKRQSAIEIMATESHINQKIIKSKSLPETSLLQKFNFSFTVVEMPIDEHKYEIQTIDDCETATRKMKKKKSKKKQLKKSKLTKAAKTVNNINAFIRKE